MDPFTAIVAFFDSNVILKLIGLFIAAGVVVYGSYRFGKLLIKVEKMLSEDHGNPQVHYVLLSDIKKDVDSLIETLDGHIPLCDEHFQDIDKIASLEPFQHCPVESCVVFQRVQGGYKDLQARLEIFEVEAVNARQRTVELLEKVYGESVRLGGEVVLALRENKRN